MNIQTLTEFLGWCSLINIILLMLTFFMLTFAFKPISKIHSMFFNNRLDESYLYQAYFDWMAKYKMLIIFFNIVPYFVLKILVI